ncbi:MAG: hypothetical protein ACOYU7_04705 [Bacillota bacterium]
MKENTKAVLLFIFSFIMAWQAIEKYSQAGYELSQLYLFVLVIAVLSTVGAYLLDRKKQ